jgi:long-subunit acyl-CoA synthetase (AMP-forming)
MCDTTLIRPYRVDRLSAGENHEDAFQFSAYTTCVLSMSNYPATRNTHPTTPFLHSNQIGVEHKVEEADDKRPSCQPQVVSYEDAVSLGREQARKKTVNTKRDPEVAVGVGDEGVDKQLVMLLPTSGTSGRPKLTMVTDAMMMAQCRPPKQVSY